MIDLSENKPERRINPMQEIIHNTLFPEDPVPVHTSIGEDDIRKFCKSCDLYVAATNSCKIVNENDQARYAARQWCGWASQNGVSGQMTKKGFES